MDYEKAYKEALERARSYYNNEEVRVGMTPIELEEIFPELKENEDGDNKRISKEITRFLKQNNGWNREWLDWLEKQSEQKSTWSEEDEEILRSIMATCELACEDRDSSPVLKMQLNWLKSLKDRVIPQSKQEWSEEDEDYFDAIITKLEVTQEDAALTDNQLKFLKSLKYKVFPQNHWTPSDEQMEALYEETQKSDRIRDGRIVSLYNDLKKLKGE